MKRKIIKIDLSKLSLKKKIKAVEIISDLVKTNSITVTKLPA